jgi:hypothetical protein
MCILKNNEIIKNGPNFFETSKFIVIAIFSLYLQVVSKVVLRQVIVKANNSQKIMPCVYWLTCNPINNPIKTRCVCIRTVFIQPLLTRLKNNVLPVFEQTRIRLDADALSF